MKLESFQVQNFRSIIDSTPIRVADITVLIGPNQAGKSSILQGLDKLSFDARFDAFDLTQLKGVSKQYLDGDLAPADIPIATATFCLDENESVELKNVLPQLATAPSKVTVTKTFDNWFRFSIAERPVAFPSRTLVETGKRKLLALLQDLEQAVQPHLGRHPNNQLRNELNQTVLGLRTTLGETLPTADTMNARILEFSKPVFDQPLKNELSTRASDMAGYSNGCFPSTVNEAQLFNYFLERLPRTAYFKTYERLEDSAPVEDLLKDDGQYPTFRNLLKLADLRVERLKGIRSEKQRQVYVENVSGRVTRLLREAWKGEDLHLQLRLSDDGKVLAFTKDSAAVETLLPPSSGSEGFQWWLGFYITFGASTDTEYKNAILLLDDPGVFLHPTGHKDLLKLFDSYLSKDVTTVYTTQIPFLIPREHLDRIRLVTKDHDGKSKVEENWFRGADTDVLAPLRAALGVSLGDSLFAGKNTIVVEGLSDRILVRAILEHLSVRGARKFEDLSNLEILGGNGAPSLLNLALLLQIQNLPYVVLLDNDDEGRKARESFPKSGIPSDNIVMLPLPPGSGRVDADIEDLFPVEMFAEAFQRVHGTKMKVEQAQVLEALRKGSGKLTNRARTFLRDRASRYDLDKTAIAYELAGQLHATDDLEAEVRSRFEQLADSIGARLSIYPAKPN